MKKYFHCSFRSCKESFKHFVQKINPAQTAELEPLFKKFGSQFLIITALILLSLFSEFLPNLMENKKKPLSLDALIPKDFVLLPVEIINGKDIINLMGSHGVVDLYAYSDQSQLPEKLAASAVKVIPPNREEGRWTALVPEKQAPYLFEYPDSFYAVIQNPNKKSSKIYRKKKKKSLVVIEENF